ncbi:hypothetical protein AUC71_01805 [Methyloceanibacter marginalis]|jgi:hypothetical protein|uniref:Uncharacterized protein n=1 Tax=Methyloceanibacter marginalis TaxID=1774971 RepID=A0A1E3W9C9_9HYPH|nr:hypothetical protein [Methyloceanibacter marginalis]ODS02350.1 hypothetical protein AUC71_01805 [Methyloceanibacter marginalis]
MLAAWMKLAFTSAQAWQEAQVVMSLRAMRLARGGALAQAEATRMVTEKSAALVDAAMTVATGGSAEKVVRGYRTRVRANKRRLTR